MTCIKRLVAMFVATASVLFAVSCSEETAVNVKLASKDNMIPDNAVLAVKVMPEQFWGKLMGNPGSKAQNLWNMAKLYLPLEINKYGEFGKVIKAAMDDPATLGVRLNEPIVMTMSLDLNETAREKSTGEICFVALLENSESFIKAVDALVEYAEVDGGMDIQKSSSDSYTHYQAFSEIASIDLGVTSESAVLRYTRYHESNVPTDLSSSMVKLFANGKQSSKSGVTGFYSSTSDLALWLDFEGAVNAFVPMVKDEKPEAADMLEGVSSFYEGVSLFAQLDFKKGETVMSLDVCGSEKIKEVAQKYLTEASDEQFKYLPNSALVTANLAIKDLPGLVDEICGLNEGFSQTLAEVGINDYLIAGGPGQIAVAFTPRYGKLQYGLAVECTRNVWDFLKRRISKKNPGLVEWYTEDVGVVNDETIFMYYEGAVRTYDQYAYYLATYGNTFNLSDYAEDIKDGGIVLNLRAMDNYPEVFDEMDLDAWVMTFSEGFTGVKLSLKMSDKSSTLLDKVVNFAADQIRY